MLHRLFFFSQVFRSRGSLGSNSNTFRDIVPTGLVLLLWLFVMFGVLWGTAVYAAAPAKPLKITTLNDGHISSNRNPTFRVKVAEGGGTVRLYSDAGCATAQSAAKAVPATAPYLVDVRVSTHFSGGSGLKTVYAKHFNASGEGSLCSSVFSGYTLDRTYPALVVKSRVNNPDTAEFPITFTDTDGRISNTDLNPLNLFESLEISDNDGGSGKLDIDGLSLFDAFASSAAIAGDTLAIGARHDDDGNGTNSGAVYLFTKENNIWKHTLKISEGVGVGKLDITLNPDDNFGSSVALGGAFLVVGAPGDDSGGNDKGAVYVFTKGADGSWSKTLKISDDPVAGAGKLNITQPIDNGSEFGSSVAIDTTPTLPIIVVGVPMYDSQKGAVHLFEKQASGNPNSNGWQTRGYIRNQSDFATSGFFRVLTSGDRFGFSVALDGDVLVVGAPGDDEGGTPGLLFNISDKGAVYLFNKEASNYWTKTLKISDNDFGDKEIPVALSDQNRFGSSVALDDDLLAVGIPGYHASGGFENAGAVYLFAKNTAGKWLQTYTISDAAKGGRNLHVDFVIEERFGSSVALDGDTLVAGGTLSRQLIFPRNDSKVGTVRLFQGNSVRYRNQKVNSCPTLPPQDSLPVAEGAGTTTSPGKIILTSTAHPRLCVWVTDAAGNVSKSASAVGALRDIQALLTATLATSWSDPATPTRSKRLDLTGVSPHLDGHHYKLFPPTVPCTAAAYTATGTPSAVNFPFVSATNSATILLGSEAANNKYACIEIQETGNKRRYFRSPTVFNIDRTPPVFSSAQGGYRTLTVTMSEPIYAPTTPDIASFSIVGSPTITVSAVNGIPATATAAVDTFTLTVSGIPTSSHTLSYAQSTTVPKRIRDLAQNSMVTTTLQAIVPPAQSITIGTISGDNIINIAEAAGAGSITIAGTSTGLSSSTNVTVGIDDTDAGSTANYTKIASTVVNGNWTVDFTKANIRTLLEGEITISATVAGGTAAPTKRVHYDPTRPSVKKIEYHSAILESGLFFDSGKVLAAGVSVGSGFAIYTKIEFADGVRYVSGTGSVARPALFYLRDGVATQYEIVANLAALSSGKCLRYDSSTYQCFYMVVSGDSGRFKSRVGAATEDNSGNTFSADVTEIDTKGLVFDTVSPTLNSGSTGYYSDSNFSTPLSGTVPLGGKIYTEAVFSKGLKNVTASDNSARPALFYVKGGVSTQYEIVAHTATLSSGDCKAKSNTDTTTYRCLYTVVANDLSPFKLRVGAATEDILGNTFAADVDYTALRVDTVAPTVTSTDYYSDVGLSNALTEYAKPGDTIYTKVVFSENVQVVTGTTTSARPALFYLKGANETRYGIVAHTATLNSGQCKAKSGSDTSEYTCLYTVVATDSGAFKLVVGTATIDMAGLFLARRYTATEITLDNTVPTVSSVGYYSDAGLTMSQSGTITIPGTKIYTKAVFSEDLKNVTGTTTSARPALFYVKGTDETQYEIVAHTATLNSGQCKARHETRTHEYECFYTVAVHDNTKFTFKVGTATTDKAGNALASPYVQDDAASLILDTDLFAVTYSLTFSGVESSGDERYLNAGDTIQITLQFSTSVAVGVQPILQFKNDTTPLGSPVTATGSGATRVATFTVSAGMSVSSNDLKYVMTNPGDIRSLNSAESFVTPQPEQIISNTTIDTTAPAKPSLDLKASSDSFTAFGHVILGTNTDNITNNLTPIFIVSGMRDQSQTNIGTEKIKIFYGSSNSVTKDTGTLLKEKVVTATSEEIAISDMYPGSRFFSVVSFDKAGNTTSSDVLPVTFKRSSGIRIPSPGDVTLFADDDSGFANNDRITNKKRIRFAVNNAEPNGAVSVITGRADLIKSLKISDSGGSSSTELDFNLEPDDLFGSSVALDTDTLAVGIPHYVDSTPPSYATGAVYLFTSVGNSWETLLKISDNNSAEGELDVPSINEDDQFGSAVALEGDTLVVGSPGNDDGNGDDSGAVYLFTKENNIWKNTLKISEGVGAGKLDIALTSGDQFGSSVALDGNTLAVGAIGDAGAGAAGYHQGAVYLFTKNAHGDWSKSLEISATSSELSVSLSQFNLFGSSVALDGNTLAVGAIGDPGSGAAADNQGAVHLFTKEDTLWTQTFKISNTLSGLDNLNIPLATSSAFGSSVALKGGTLIVGASGGGGKGAVHFFVKSEDVWTRPDTLEITRRLPKEISDRTADGVTKISLKVGDSFGSSVAYDGTRLVVGAPNDDSGGVLTINKGAVYFFKKAVSVSDDAVLVDGQGVGVTVPHNLFATDEDSNSERLFSGFDLRVYDNAGNFRDAYDSIPDIYFDSLGSPQIDFALQPDSDSAVIGDSVTSDNTPTFDMSPLGIFEERFGDGATVVLYQWNDANSDNFISNAELTAVYTIANTTTATATYISPDLDDGAYFYVIDITDDAGNTTRTPVGDVFEILIDTTKPEAPDMPDLRPLDDTYGSNPNYSRRGTDSDNITSDTSLQYFVTASKREFGETFDLSTVNDFKRTSPRGREQNHILFYYLNPTTLSNYASSQAPVTPSWDGSVWSGSVAPVAVRGFGASATATLSAGSVGSVQIDDGGSGYVPAPSVEITPFSAVAVAKAVVGSNGAISSITVVSGGSGYTSTPAVTINSRVGSGAVARATVTNGQVSSISVTTAGAGYSAGNIAVEIDLPRPPGSGAVAKAVVGSDGTISSITVDSGGSGYATAPSIVVTGGGGSGAIADATIANGRVSSISVTTAGTGYALDPSVSFVDGGGSGAVAKAFVGSDGTISSITVVSGGSGYTSTPAVIFQGTVNTHSNILPKSVTDGFTWGATGKLEKTRRVGQHVDLYYSQETGDYYRYVVAKQRDLAGNESDYSVVQKIRVDKENPLPVSVSISLHPSISEPSSISPVFRTLGHSTSDDVDYYEVWAARLSADDSVVGDWFYPSSKLFAQQGSYNYVSGNTPADIAVAALPKSGYVGNYPDGVTLKVDSLTLPQYSSQYRFKLHTVDKSGNRSESSSYRDLRLLIVPPTPSVQTVGYGGSETSLAQFNLGVRPHTSAVDWRIAGSYTNVSAEQKNSDVAAEVIKVITTITNPNNVSRTVIRTRTTSSTTTEIRPHDTDPSSSQESNNQIYRFDIDVNLVSLFGANNVVDGDYAIQFTAVNTTDKRSPVSTSVILALDRHAPVPQVDLVLRVSQGTDRAGNIQHIFSSPASLREPGGSISLSRSPSGSSVATVSPGTSSVIISSSNVDSFSADYAYYATYVDALGNATTPTLLTDPALISSLPPIVHSFDIGSRFYIVSIDPRGTATIDPSKKRKVAAASSSSCILGSAPVASIADGLIYQVNETLHIDRSVDVCVGAQDSNGNAAFVRARQQAIDLVTQDLTIIDDTGVSSTDLETSDNTPLLNFTIIPEKRVLIEMKKGSGSWAKSLDILVSQEVTSKKDGSVSHQVVSALEDGVYDVRVWVSFVSDVHLTPKASGIFVDLDFITIETVAPLTPVALDLAAADDTGIYAIDNITTVGSGLTISGCAEEGSVVELLDNGVSFETPVKVIIGSATGRCTGTTKIFSVDVSLTEGAHVLAAEASDDFGNTSVLSRSLSVTVDTTAPTVSVIRTVGADNNTGTTGRKYILVALDAHGIAARSYKEISGTSCSGSTGFTRYTGEIAATVHKNQCFRVVDMAGNSVHMLQAAAPYVIGSPSFTTGSLVDAIYYVQSGARIFTGATSHGATIKFYKAEVDSTDYESVTERIGSDVVLAPYVNAISTPLTLPVGNYKLLGSVIPQGGTETSKVFLLEIRTVDTPPAAPRALRVATADDTGIYATDNITKTDLDLMISGCAEEGSTVDLLNNGVSFDTPVKVVVGSATGSCTGSAKMFSVDVSLTEGIYTLVAKSTGIAGNSSGFSDPLSLTIDTTAPTVSVIRTAGVDNAVTTTGRKYIIAASDAYGIAIRSYKEISDTTCSGSTGFTSYTGEIAATATMNQCFRVVDIAGNVTYALQESATQGIGTSSFTTGSLDNNTYYIRSGTQTFTGVTTAGATIKFYKAALADTTYASITDRIGSDVVLSQDTGAISTPLTLPSGNYKLLGSVTPRGGTETPKTFLLTIHTNDTAPTIGLDSIISNNVDNTSATSGNTITVIFSATQKISLADTVVTVAGVPTTCTTRTTGTVLQAHTYTCTVTAGNSMAEGSSSVAITGSNFAGTPFTTTFSSPSITIDSSAPSVSFSSAASLVGTGKTVSVTMSIADINGILTTFPLNNIPITGATPATVSLASAEQTFTLTAGAAQGAVTIDMPVLADTVGNSYDAPVETLFFIDTTAPVISASTSFTGSKKKATITLTADHNNPQNFTKNNNPIPEEIHLVFGGTCDRFTPSQTVTVSDGRFTQQTHTFTVKAPTGTYAANSCTVVMVDGAGNRSAPFTIPQAISVKKSSSGGGGGRIGHAITSSFSKIVAQTFGTSEPETSEQRSPQTPSVPVTAPTTQSKTYTLGDRHPTIKQAQALLNSTSCPVSSSGPGSSGSETEYLGRLTVQALLCYQKQNALAETSTLTPETFNHLTGQRTSQVPAPQIATPQTSVSTREVADQRSNLRERLLALVAELQGRLETLLKERAVETETVSTPSTEISPPPTRVTPSATPQDSIRWSYRLGDSDILKTREVRRAQVLLNNTSCPVATSGPGSSGSETDYFGPKMDAAIRCYQKLQGLPVDGVLTPALYASLVAPVDTSATYSPITSPITRQRSQVGLPTNIGAPTL